MAGPSAPGVFDITQPDGTAFKAKKNGDEFQNWTEAEDTGHTVIKNSVSGDWEYAEQNVDSTLKPSGMKVLPNGMNPSARIKKN